MVMMMQDTKFGEERGVEEGCFSPEKGNYLRSCNGHDTGGYHPYFHPPKRKSNVPVPGVSLAR